MTLDWQTLVVTLIALGAAGAVARRFIPKRRRPGAPAAAACEHCESGAASIKAAPQGSAARTQTTPVVSLDDLRASVRRR